ncbi:MAG: aminoacyl-tRNA hydrolase [Eubacteriales bacterium]|jgi:PTH1 family peptidyl-tRNA hydrolase
MPDLIELFKKISRGERDQSPPTHIVVGLGNPGDKYTYTRHNAGFLALAYIAEKLGVKVNRAKFRSLTARAEISGTGVILLAPQTFMNLSGEAVRECADFYRVPPENIIVISDDINLDVGRLRVRRSGSDGGHKGLFSIINQLESDAFPRLRVGVGAPLPGWETVDWVLSEFSEREQKILFDIFGYVFSGIEKIVAGDIGGAMQLCNSLRLGETDKT